MRIGVFGGRFDPIHNGHLAVAKEVLKMGKADEVWLSIENQHQWRPIIAAANDRKKMAELAIDSITDVILSNAKDIYSSAMSQNDKNKIAVSPEAPRNDIQNNFKVDMTPVELGGTTETIQVVRQLRKKYPEHEFIFIVGSDQLPTFHKWSHWEDLKKEVQFLIVTRKGSPLDNIPKNASVITDPTYEPLDDSATRIREFLHVGTSISGLVPKAVEEYIKEHKLYQ
ncbi:MAG TPA: nicotinate-nucleotide adenylyltransferase [Patescibacteria group bacterium]|nr:nicotinate-nucleotide adenylyltransferase [Patescibacteria group bacterium]